jgi:hypothetical protein
MSQASTQKKQIKRHPIIDSLKPLYNDYIAAQTNQSKLLTEGNILWNNGTQIKESVFDNIKTAIDETVDKINLVVEEIETFNDGIDYRQSIVSEDFDMDRSIIDYDEKRFEALKGIEKDLNKNKAVILKLFHRALALYEVAKQWQTWWNNLMPILKEKNKMKPQSSMVRGWVEDFQDKKPYGATNDAISALNAARGRHKKSKRRQKKPKKKQTKSK